MQSNHTKTYNGLRECRRWCRSNQKMMIKWSPMGIHVHCLGCDHEWDLPIMPVH